MIPPIAGETTLVTPGASARIRSARALQSFSVWAAYWNTLAFCRKTGERRPDDRMKWPSSMAPHSRKMASTSSFVIDKPLVYLAVPFQRRDHAHFADAGALDGGKPRTALERCQNIGELRKVAHLDLENHLVKVGRNHPHDQIVDIGVAGGDGRGNLRQRAGLVDRFHGDDGGIEPVFAALEVPAHVHPGHVAVMLVDQGFGMDGVDQHGAIGL